MLEAITLEISINSSINNFNSFLSPLSVSLSKVNQTFDSFEDFKECVKKFVKSFLELAEFAYS